MKILHDIRLLFWRKMMETLRNPIYIIVSMLTPVVYLLLFSPLLKKLSIPGYTSKDILNLFVPGLLVIVAFLSGLFVGYTMIDEVKTGVIERFRVTPVSRFEGSRKYPCYCHFLYAGCYSVWFSCPCSWLHCATDASGYASNYYIVIR